MEPDPRLQKFTANVITDLQDVDPPESVEDSWNDADNEDEDNEFPFGDERSDRKISTARSQ